ncbi:MAG TPA: hypothetical protein VFZ08_08670 [Terriglobia bacterium]|nr:hypothetical protein [Terriglobia bacterium]
MSKAALFLAGACLLAAIPLAAFQSAAPAATTESCKDPEAVVTAVQQDLAATVSAVKKESLDDFEREFHQQASMSKLSIYLRTVSDVLSCFEKASQDPQVSQSQRAEIQRKQSTYKKLQTTAQADLQELKTAKEPKVAKADVEKFDFTP